MWPNYLACSISYNQFESHAVNLYLNEHWFLKNTDSLFSLLIHSPSLRVCLSLMKKKEYELVKKYASGDWEGSIHENLCGEYLSWTGKKKTSVELLVIVLFCFVFLVIFCHCRLFWGLTAEQAGLGGQHVKMCFALLMRQWHQASNGDHRRNECLKSSPVWLSHLSGGSISLLSDSRRSLTN